MNESDSLSDLYEKIVEERNIIDEDRFQLCFLNGESLYGDDESKESDGVKLAFDIINIKDDTEEAEIALVGKEAGLFSTVVKIRSIDVASSADQKTIDAASSKERYIIVKTKKDQKAMMIEGKFKKFDCLERKHVFVSIQFDRAVSGLFFCGPCGPRAWYCWLQACAGRRF